MSKFRLEGSSALITGASAGIGREFARQLAGRASSLLLVARRQERLEELHDELTKRDPNLKVQIRATDLSDERAVIELFDWLEREKIPIDLLINNAGLGDVGPFATSELPRVKEMLAVNVTALTLLTRLLLPGMIAQRPARFSTSAQPPASSPSRALPFMPRRKHTSPVFPKRFAPNCTAPA